MFLEHSITQIGKKMIDTTLLLAVFVGIVVLLFLIIRLKIQAFTALLIASITVGLVAGMHPTDILETIKKGMGGTLGFVAVVVGLGAIFGAILEHSGGASALATFLMAKFGKKRASWALMIAGFLIAIPVFFDVAFIILIPIIYSIQRNTKKSLLYYAIPLLAGLAITHAFIPPTPGPVAVAEILKADLGWVILFGFIVGIPTAIASGPLFTNYIAKRIFIEAPEEVSEAEASEKKYPAIALILFIIGIPILLIVVNTVLNTFSDAIISAQLKSWIGFIGHPFVALIIANLLAWYLLGIKRGATKESLLKIATKSLGPAGIIILLTGAGGVFKQILIATGSGKMLAEYFATLGLSVFVVAYICALLIRVLQGSATVAMITAAGMVAPLISGIGDLQKALLVITIAAGASAMSHVNDSGFWLVSNYLGMTEKQTFKSWTMMTTVLSLVGFISALIISLFV